MAPVARCTGRHRSLLYAAAVLAGLAFAAMTVSLPSAALAAASPSVAQPTVSGATSTVEAWLDVAIPPDTPAGGVVRVAITFWDTSQGAFADESGVYVKLYPAKGKAAPTVVTTIDSDWPGHVFASVTVPQGGPGTVEVGRLIDGKAVPLRLAGVGPPSGAPLSSLVGVVLEPIVGDVVAGRPFPLTMDIVPLGAWAMSSLALPARLKVNATAAGGTVVATAQLAPVGIPGVYTGHLTIPETGKVDVAPVLPDDTGTVRFLAGSSGQLTVIEAGRRSSPTPGAPAPGQGVPGASRGTPEPGGVVTPGTPASGGDLPILPLLAVGVLLVLGGLGARWLLADR